MPKPLPTGTGAINPLSTTSDGTTLAILRAKPDGVIKLTATLGSNASPISLGNPDTFNEPSLWAIQHSGGLSGIFTHVGGSTAVDILVADSGFIATASPTADQVAFYNDSGTLKLAVGSNVDAAETYWQVRRLI